MKEFLFLESSNFSDFPLGGSLSFDKNILKVFGDQASYAGVVEEKDMVGKWQKISISGQKVDYFGLCTRQRIEESNIPARLLTLYLVGRHWRKIQASSYARIFTQAPHFVIGLRWLARVPVVFCFAGLANSVGISRYKYLRWLGGVYEWTLVACLRHEKFQIFAASDGATIAAFRKKNRLEKDILSLPTLVDLDLFQEFKVSPFIKGGGYNIVTVGRLAEVKGWRLMLDAFAQFLEKYPRSVFHFIGSGEDYDAIKAHVDQRKLNESVVFVGRKSGSEVLTWLSSADLFVMGSYVEGWSTALLEAVLMGCRCVVTDFSSAKDLVKSGTNGYVSHTRDPSHFANLMLQAMELKVPGDFTTFFREEYSISTLKTRLNVSKT